MKDTTLRDGDIYRWYYREGYGGEYPYHCKSNIAIVISGHLYDTYWSSPGSSYKLVPKEVTLMFLGNKNEMTLLRPHEARYYRSSDVVDTRHLNDSTAPVYAKKGAKRDAAVMRALAFELMGRAEREIRHKKNRISDIEAAILAIERGDLEDIELPQWSVHLSKY